MTIRTRCFLLKELGSSIAFAVPTPTLSQPHGKLFQGAELARNPNKVNSVSSP